MRATAEWNPERQVWETDQADLFCEQREPFSETWPTSGMTRSGALLPLPRSGRRTGGSGSSSSPTPPASSGTGGSLLPTPLSGDGTKGSPNQKYSDGNPSLAPAVIALGKDLFPTPKATDGVFATPTNPGRSVDKSTFLGTIVAKVVAPLNPGPMLATPDTMPDAPQSNSNKLGPAGLKDQIVEAQRESGHLLPTPTALQAGNTPENWLQYKNGRRKVGDLKVLVENPALLESGGVLPAEGEMTLLPTPRAAQGETRNSTIYARAGGDRGNLESALANVPEIAAMLPDRTLLPTPVCTDAFGAARHTTTTGVMHSGTSLTDAIRLLPTPSAVDGHPSSPGRHNSEGHQSTLPGVAKEIAESGPLLPTPCAKQSGCTPEDSIKNKPPGRRQITDLSIMVSNPGLLESGGVPDWLATEEGPEEPGLF